MINHDEPFRDQEDLDNLSQFRFGVSEQNILFAVFS